MGRGHPAFPRIFSGASRRARLFTKPTTPNLHIEYTGLNPEPTSPDVDAVKRRLPPPRARISGMAASVVTSTVRRLRSRARSKALMSMPSTAAGPGCPTWFQTKSSPLKRLTVSHTMRRESSSLVRSAAIPSAAPPAAVISLTTRCTPAASTSTTATCAPSRAKRRAPARPMPEAAAVTIPIFPDRRIDRPPGSVGAKQRVGADSIPLPGSEQSAPELVGGREIAVGGEADEEQRAERGGRREHEHDDHLVADRHERRGAGQDLARHHPGQLHQADRHHPVHRGDHRRPQRGPDHRLHGL